MNEILMEKLEANKAGIWEDFEIGDLKGVKLMDLTGKTLHMLFLMDNDKKWYQEFTQDELQAMWKKNGGSGEASIG